MKTLTLRVVKFWTLAVVILLALAPTRAEAQRKLYSISSLDDKFRVINSSTGATLFTVTITLFGATIIAGNGLARDPTTGKLWALLTLSGSAPRLVTIDPSTGVATSIGDTGDRFAGLAFASDGTLYGVQGDGPNVPETFTSLTRLTPPKLLSER